MRVMPIRYARDVDASVRFYRVLGLDLQAVSRPGAWAELTGSAGVLAVHAGGDSSAGSCELAFEADEPLEAVVGRLRSAGFACEDVVDENFGRSVRVADPDGAWVQVNEHDRELYT
jgi:catechol 2,3-dioxygenase-like lactoylglutathione lyase family enzyme